MIDKKKIILNPNMDNIKEQIRESGGFGEIITKFVGNKETSATIIRKKKF